MRRRFFAWVGFAAKMFLPPLLVVIAVVAYVTTPLWWNDVFGWMN